jgi:hypothetical protein
MVVNVLQKVVKELVYRGPLALQDIGRFSGLNAAALKTSILVLVQHSCVQAFKVEHEGEMKCNAVLFLGCLVENGEPVVGERLE